MMNRRTVVATAAAILLAPAALSDDCYQHGQLGCCTLIGWTADWVICSDVYCEDTIRQDQLTWGPVQDALVGFSSITAHEAFYSDASNDTKCIWWDVSCEFNQLTSTWDCVVTSAEQPCNQYALSVPWEEPDASDYDCDR